MMQSRDTKNLHCDQDLDEILSKIKQTSESTRTKRFWSQLENVLYVVAEWVSMKEMKAPQGVCMLTSMRARERHNEELLSDLDDQVWKNC